MDYATLNQDCYKWCCSLAAKQRGLIPTNCAELPLPALSLCAAKCPPKSSKWTAPSIATWITDATTKIKYPDPASRGSLVTATMLRVTPAGTQSTTSTTPGKSSDFTLIGGGPTTSLPPSQIPPDISLPIQPEPDRSFFDRNRTLILAAGAAAAFAVIAAVVSRKR